MTPRRFVAASCLCVVIWSAPAVALAGWEGAFDAAAARKEQTGPERHPLPVLALAAETAAPAYPAEAAAAGNQGVVSISFAVMADGTVPPRSVKVAESSGTPALDDQAVAWARTLRFAPLGKEQGHSIGQYFRLGFSLSGGKPTVSATPVALLPPIPDPSRPQIGKPPYPREALDARKEGAAILEFRVRSDGFPDPSTIRIVRSSGTPVLDEAAVADARTTWRYLPAIDDAQRPVSAWTMQKAEFKLRNR